MGYTNERFEPEHSLDQLIDLAEAASIDKDAAWEVSKEIDFWAQRALAANGFGDY